MDKLAKAVYLIIFGFCLIGIVPMVLLLATSLSASFGAGVMIPIAVLTILFIIAVPYAILKS